MKKLIYSWITAVATSVSAVQAAPFYFDATPVDPSLSGGFTIYFEDGMGTGALSDGLLQFGEILRFSGLTITCCGVEGTYSDVTQVPDIPGFATFGVTHTSPPVPGSDWVFTTPIDIAADRSGFTYQITPVPLPASFLLLGGAMAGLAGLRRRKT